MFIVEEYIKQTLVILLVEFFLGLLFSPEDGGMKGASARLHGIPEEELFVS
jgi:hypothetical protein